MTLAPSDSPDWTGIPGALRYLGSIDMSGSGAVSQTFAFGPASYDGAVYIIPSGAPNAVNNYARVQVRLSGGSPVFGEWWPYQSGAYAAEPFVAFVSAALGLAWEVNATISNAGSSNWKLYVFAAPTFPLVNQAGTTAPPVVQTMWTPPKRPYDWEVQATPAVNVAATVTVPAVNDERILVDHVAWTIRANAAPAAVVLVTPQVFDSGLKVLWSSLMALPVSVGAVDRIIIGPGLGLVGTVGLSVTCEFSAAGGANTAERVSAGGWYLPGFL